jgi:hypothetical protein
MKASGLAEARPDIKMRRIRLLELKKAWVNEPSIFMIPSSKSWY